MVGLKAVVFIIIKKETIMSDINKYILPKAKKLIKILD
jgi:hypothetical protein